MLRRVKFVERRVNSPTTTELEIQIAPPSVPSPEATAKTPQEIQAELIKLEAILKIRYALRGAIQAERKTAEIEPGDSIFDGAREFWSINAEILVTAINPNAHTSACAQAKRDGKQEPLWSEFYPGAAMTFFAWFVRSARAVGRLNLTISRDEQRIKALMASAERGEVLTPLTRS